ncbi:protein fmp52-2- mitochondrial [Apiospora saccharicola]|uniref:Protein fmp52-2- mitochondrial n=1 Tax=Apiospora saccharicola TaxID=335842 RepID=A0ABR1UKP8_9PEZI
MATAAVFGCTGAVGAEILAALLAPTTSAFASIKTISRRTPAATSPKLEAIQEADTAKWGGLIGTFAPSPSVVFNAVGTTRATAGGIAEQWKIDHDLCVENAKAAKAAGVKTYVFISSAGTRSFPSSMAPYCKMKNGVEDAIKELQFEHAVIVKPGMIIAREKSKAWLAEKVVETMPQMARDRLGQDASVIGRAAVAAAQMVEQGKAPSKYWEVGMADILKMGREEWQK